MDFLIGLLIGGCVLIAVTSVIVLEEEKKQTELAKKQLVELKKITKVLEKIAKELKEK